MDNKLLFKFCKDLGCCDACCFRYMGYKKPNVYESVKQFAEEYQDSKKSDASFLDNKDTNQENNVKTDVEPINVKHTQTKVELNSENGPAFSMDVDDSNECKDVKVDLNIKNSTENSNKSEKTISENIPESQILNENNEEVKSINEVTPPCKKRRLDVCVSCLGVLQEEFWDDTIVMIKDMLEKKGYECKTYTCGLSAPISTILREKIITLKIAESFSDYDPNTYTQLKDAWKMSFRQRVGGHIDKTFETDSPLLIMVHLDYPDDLQELEVLKKVSPYLFKNRSKYKRRFPTEFTRQSVEQSLEDATLATLMSSGAQLTAHGHAQCVSVVCAHAPAYLGGRYIKLNRNLPQSPWILEGRRVLPTSVQEIIFEPLAKLLKLSDTDVESRLKFIAAGREDVDVRCLGDGRPFAIEISDPIRQLTREELEEACRVISKSGDVSVESLTYLCKDDLIQLKKGEETKCKTYEALCIKLTRSKFDEDTPDPVKVTEKDIDYINSYRNTDPSDPARVNITQKTPIRVLHRRPLLARTRHILDLQARLVPDYPQLFLLTVRTSAGTYVKEWVHGELSRSSPSLSHALDADIDLLALDVTEVHLQWPPNK